MNVPLTLVPDEFREVSGVILVTEIDEIKSGAAKQLGVADLRDLHAWLEVGTEYPLWIARRAAKLGFTEGFDFAENLDPSVLKDQDSHGGDRRSTSHRGTLRMAKHLCLAERKPRGSLMRDYFIWAEGRAFGQPAHGKELATGGEEWRRHCMEMERRNQDTHTVLAGKVSHLTLVSDNHGARIDDHEVRISLFESVAPVYSSNRYEFGSPAKLAACKAFIRFVPTGKCLVSGEAIVNSDGTPIKEKIAYHHINSPVDNTRSNIFPVSREYHRKADTTSQRRSSGELWRRLQEEALLFQGFWGRNDPDRGEAQKRRTRSPCPQRTFRAHTAAGQRSLPLS